MTFDHLHLPWVGILTNYFVPGVGNLTFFMENVKIPTPCTTPPPPSGLTLIGALSPFVRFVYLHFIYKKYFLSGVFSARLVYGFLGFLCLHVRMLQSELHSHVQRRKNSQDLISMRRRTDFL